MRTISLSWKAPERMTATSRSPPRPAARVSAVAGTKARPRGASPSVNRARLVRPPSAVRAKISPPCRSPTKSSPAGPAARACAIGPSRTRRDSPRGLTRQIAPGPGCHGASAPPPLPPPTPSRSAPARPPRGGGVARGAVVDPAAAGARAGARRGEGAGRIYREGGRRRDSRAGRPSVPAGARAGHVDAGREAGREEDVGGGRGRGETD